MHRWPFAASSASLFAIVVAVGCGASTSAGGGGDGGVIDAATDAPVRPAGFRPPSRPAGEPKTGRTVWYVVDRFFLGTVSWEGKTDANAWKTIGYDLDRRTTTAVDSPTSTNSCKRASGSSTNILLDGNKGTDNNFGRGPMSVLKALKSDFEESVTSGIRDGAATWLLKIDNFTDEDNSLAPGALYLATDFNQRKTAPAFTATEKGWAIDPSSLIDGSSIAQPKAAFANGYIANGTWVSGDFGAATIDVNVPIARIPLSLQGGVLAIELATGRGTVAGGMGATALLDAMLPFAKQIGICPGNATWDQIADTIKQSVDLRLDAPDLQDTESTCDAVSIGIGFGVKPTGDHALAPVRASTPSTSGCP